MLAIFQLLVFALVLTSLVLVVGVPVAYAGDTVGPRAKGLITVGSLAWVALVIVIGVVNFFVA
ncbi:MAG: photosystem II reaction center protein PsbZ [Prochlorothrix sp.]|nr:photosystem II reaction center protein PsbZ [Prochlorothrix sp.]